MSPQELTRALQELDKLYIQKDSFRSWLAGDTQANNKYTQVKERIETAFPGLRVIYVNVTYKDTHALIADE